MFGLENLDALFAIRAFLFQIILIVPFALRKWKFDIAVCYGIIVYALSLPAVAISIILLLGGKTWSRWLGGFIYLVWAVYCYLVEYVKKVQWRDLIRWQVFSPCIFLYLAAIMFYWRPLGLLSRPLWFVYAALFIISTVLNATSHKGTITDENR